MKPTTMKAAIADVKSAAAKRYRTFRENERNARYMGYALGTVGAGVSGYLEAEGIGLVLGAKEGQPNSGTLIPGGMLSGAGGVIAGEMLGIREVADASFGAWCHGFGDFVAHQLA